MAIYKVTLTQEERGILIEIINKGRHSIQKIRTAYILLNCDEGKYANKITNRQICDVLKISMRTIDRIKKRFVEEGFEVVLQRRPTTREYKIKVDGEVEARLIALSCGEPPEGYGRWSLRLLADKMVELNYVDSISHEKVRTLLKKRIKTLEGKGMGYSTKS